MAVWYPQPGLAPQPLTSVGVTHPDLSSLQAEREGQTSSVTSCHGTSPGQQLGPVSSVPRVWPQHRDHAASPAVSAPHRPQPPSCPFGDSTNLQSDCPLLHATPRPRHEVCIVNRNKPTLAQPTCRVRVLVGHKGLGTHACVQCQPWGQCTLTHGCPCSRCPRASPLPRTHQTRGKVPRRGNAGSARDPRPRHGSPGCRAPVK